MTYRPLDFSVEIPESDDFPIAAPVKDMGQSFIAVAVDLTDAMIAAHYRLALTRDEAARLHAALGDALKRTDR